MLIICGIVLLVSPSQLDKALELPVAPVFQDHISSSFLKVSGILSIVAGVLLLIQCWVRFWVIYPNSCCYSMGERANAEMMWMLFGKDSDADYFDYDDLAKRAVPAHKLGVAPCPVAYVVKSDDSDSSAGVRRKARPNYRAKEFMVMQPSASSSVSSRQEQGAKAAFPDRNKVDTKSVSSVSLGKDKRDGSPVSPHELQEAYIKANMAPPPCPVKYKMDRSKSVPSVGSKKDKSEESQISPHELQEKFLEAHMAAPPCPVTYKVGSDSESLASSVGKRKEGSPISAHKLQENYIKAHLNAPPCPVAYRTKSQSESSAGSKGDKRSGSPLSAHKLQEDFIKAHLPAPPCPVGYKFKSDDDTGTDREEEARQIPPQEGFRGEGARHIQPQGGFEEEGARQKQLHKDFREEGARQMQPQEDFKHGFSLQPKTDYRQEETNRKQITLPKPQNMAVQFSQRPPQRSKEQEQNRIIVRSQRINSPLCQDCLDGTGHGKKAPRLDRSEPTKGPYLPPLSKRVVPSIRPSCGGANCVANFCNCVQ